MLRRRILGANPDKIVKEEYYEFVLTKIREYFDADEAYFDSKRKLGGGNYFPDRAEKYNYYQLIYNDSPSYWFFDVYKVIEYQSGRKEKNFISNEMLHVYAVNLACYIYNGKEKYINNNDSENMISKVEVEIRYVDVMYDGVRYNNCKQSQLLTSTGAYSSDITGVANGGNYTVRLSARNDCGKANITLKRNSSGNPVADITLTSP